MSLEQFLAGMEADQEKAARRQEWLEKMEKSREALEAEQRRAASADPYGQFSSRIPIDEGITVEERDQPLEAEQIAHKRHSRSAAAKLPSEPPCAVGSGLGVLLVPPLALLPKEPLEALPSALCLLVSLLLTLVFCCFLGFFTWSRFSSSL